MSPAPDAKLKDALRTGTAPAPLRSAAARGVLPLPPESLVEMQVLLVDDDDPEIRAAAVQSLAEIPVETVSAVLDDPETAEETLAFLAQSITRWPTCLPALARRRDLPGVSARALARIEAAEALAALAANEQLLGKDPELGPLLLDNPALPRASRNRLLDYLDELKKEWARESEEGLAEAEAAAARPPARDPFLAALGVDAEVEALLPQLGLDLGELAGKSELLGEEDEDDLFQRLARMNVGQKLRLAMFGTRDERRILVRDTNRIVAAAVVKNPNFTEHEAEAVSKSRNVNDEVLRLIATHRDYSKTYQIQLNLVNNPRCPHDLSLRFVQSIRDRDLRLIAKSRNVTESVRRQAKKTLEAREARRRVRIGPGKR